MLKKWDLIGNTCLSAAIAQLKLIMEQSGPNGSNVEAIFAVKLYNKDH